MKKQMRTMVMAAALAGAMVVGAAAATTVQKITADLRPDITVRVDGEKATLVDKNGNIVYPIAYEGTTYLPIRALGNLMDLEVGWNGKTQTIDLTTPTQTRPEDLTLEKLTARTEEAEDEVKALKPASTYSERAKQYALHSQTIDTIRDDLYDFGQKVNQQLRDEKITYKEYNVLVSKMDDLDNRLKDALDDLEAKTIADESDKRTLAEQLSDEIAALAKRVKEAESDISGLKPANTYKGRLEQYNAIASDLTGLSADINSMGNKLNSYLRQEKLTYKEYNSLSQSNGALDVRVKDAWDDLADKIFYEDEQPKPGNNTYKNYAKKVSDLNSEVGTLVNEAKKDGPRPGYHGNKDGWKNIEKKIDKLDDRIDDLEDEIEHAYKNGDLTRAEYKELAKALDQMDDTLDDLDDWFDD